MGGAVAGSAALLESVYSFLRSAGPTLSPFNAWIFLKGLETLPLRMRAHCEGAQVVAEWLALQPEVARVYYPGLASHPQHALAQRQQRGFGGIVTFEVKGGRAVAWRVIDATRLFSITANLGDVKSTISHPATTTHGRMSPEARTQAGVTDGLIRLSIGLEAPADLISDLALGLKG